MNFKTILTPLAISLLYMFIGTLVFNYILDFIAYMVDPSNSFFKEDLFYGGLVGFISGAYISRALLNTNEFNLYNILAPLAISIFYMLIVTIIFYYMLTFIGFICDIRLSGFALDGTFYGGIVGFFVGTYISKVLITENNEN